MQMVVDCGGVGWSLETIAYLAERFTGPAVLASRVHTCATQGAYTLES